tara:strand:+ start:110 stop:319 length:210 start_codon:yes stop_codon:yes gene_type:complete
MENFTRIKRIIENGEVNDGVFTEQMSWYLENLTPLETIHEIMNSGYSDEEILLFFKEITFNRTIKFKNK